ncbi:hypothetical protein BMS3Abin11_02580 [bacterium BMS3Abin11]|nr:hypothetical protein BMS3Abin11_02580 [bacterium BMS3Abin11]
MGRSQNKKNALLHLAQNHNFTDDDQFIHRIRAAQNVFYQALDREPPSESVKRLNRRAAGGNPRKKSMLEAICVEAELLRGAGDETVAASLAANLLVGHKRGKSAEGVFVQRVLAIWYESHGLPVVQKGWDDDVRLRGAFIDFLVDVEASIRPDRIWRNPPWRMIEAVILELKKKSS